MSSPSGTDSPHSWKLIMSERNTPRTVRNTSQTEQNSIAKGAIENNTPLSQSSTLPYDTSPRNPFKQRRLNRAHSSNQGTIPPPSEPSPQRRPFREGSPGTQRHRNLGPRLSSSYVPTSNEGNFHQRRHRSLSGYSNNSSINSGAWSPRRVSSYSSRPLRGRSLSSRSTRSRKNIQPGGRTHLDPRLSHGYLDEVFKLLTYELRTGR